MAKFTAGKWEAYSDGSVYLPNGKWYIPRGFIDDAEIKVDARLIAAAPRMYELLKQCVQEDIAPDLEGDILWLFRDIEDSDVQGNELVGG